MTDNLPEPIVANRKEFMRRPDVGKLDDKYRQFLDVYKKEKTMTRACKALGMDRYDVDKELSTNENFEACMFYAEKEIQDELEYAVMAKAGLLGDAAFKEYRKGNPNVAFSILKSKHSAYKGRAVKPTSATQINATKVTINNAGAKGSIQTPA